MADRRFTANGAAQRLHAFDGDRQPEPAARIAQLVIEMGVRAKETVEDRRLIGIRDAQAVVTNTDGADILRAGVAADGDFDEALGLLRVAVFDGV